MRFFVNWVQWLIDGYWPNSEHDAVTMVRSPRAAYSLERHLADADRSDVFLANADGHSFLLKVSRNPEGRRLLEQEHAVLRRLLAAADNRTYGRYLPELAESFILKRQHRVNVFRFDSRFRTLEEVYEQHPALDARHLAWIFNRLLTVLGFCHKQGIVHAAVLPCHVMIEAAGHGLQLIGWGQSVDCKRPVRHLASAFREWYPLEITKRMPVGPETDLFLAARCKVYLAGGDSLTNRMPDTVPEPMRRFIATCLLESPRMRPDDAWGLQQEFEHLLRRLYGAPAFHELTLT